jgi:hypothetical protein
VYAAEPGGLVRFQNEANVAGKIIDAHIVPVFEVRELQGVPVIIMPLIHGRDLGCILRDRKLIKQARWSRTLIRWHS